jgi:hypothetical protein
MRPDSAAQWREALAPFARVHLYTTDPGAHAIAVELWPLLRQTGRAGSWIAEGWSAAHAQNAKPFAAIAEAARPGDLLLSGSQTGFARTRESFALARTAGAATGFVFDHWKNYREHFEGAPLPDLIVVPDSLGHRLLLEALGHEAAPRAKILPLPSLEAAVDRVRSFAGAEAGVIALLLDPTEPAHGLGYDWRTVLTAAAAQVGSARLLVKPHPRQDVAEIGAALKKLPGVSLYEGDTEELIARAEQVWGMTTIALVTALQAGKTIRSFQIGRNEQGRLASNAYIEPFVIT